MAIAAATLEAWAGGETGASNRFLAALRRMVGAEVFDRIEPRALDLFLLQPVAPGEYEPPPPWAWFAICPGCQRLKRTPHTHPQNGRLKLQVLRDPEWIRGQIQRGRTFNEMAKQLGCDPSNIVRWAKKHGIMSPRAVRTEELEVLARQHHADGIGPGQTARELGSDPATVRKALRRMGLANNKKGQVFHNREWWVERVVRRGWTVRQCAREAGIKPHAFSHWLRQFDLSSRVAGNRRKRKYPALSNPAMLADLLRRHQDNYESVAREVGCSPPLVSMYARKLLGREKKHENHVPHSDPQWWRERLDRRMTTWEMADEAGTSEKTARERLRILGLLDEAYHVNTAREREARSSRRSA